MQKWKSSDKEATAIPDTLEQILAVLEERNEVKAFKAAEKALKENEEIWKTYQEMKKLQKEAVLFQKIGKEKFYQEKIKAAGGLEAQIKGNLLVENYYQKMKDVNDLLEYISSQIEEKVNQDLGES